VRRDARGRGMDVRNRRARRRHTRHRRLICAYRCPKPGRSGPRLILRGHAGAARGAARTAWRAFDVGWRPTAVRTRYITCVLVPT
jgi:hypothetical protein